jgi:hypothetical protein
VIEPMNDQPTEQRELDEALAQAREAFAGKGDDELLDEITDVIDQVRASRRREMPSSTSS